MTDTKDSGRGGNILPRKPGHKKRRGIRNKIPTLEVVAAAMMHDVDIVVHGGGGMIPP
jgi:hypothetical protein